MTSQKQNRRARLYEIIFEADTPMGKLFDVVLLWTIVVSIALVMLESIQSIGEQYSTILNIGEWTITFLFTIEYFLRIYVLKKPIAYIFSFYGVVDLLSLIPTYLGLFFMGTEGLMVIRALRLLRVFRILKLTRYTVESKALLEAIKSNRHKLSVFLFFILTMVTILGTIMYLVEGEKNGFTSIPESIYWAIVTLTTVGYGDIAPQTDIGRLISSFVMILGYVIIAVPTGIVTVAMAKSKSHDGNTQVCPRCLHDTHDFDAIYCKKCGEKLNIE